MSIGKITRFIFGRRFNKIGSRYRKYFFDIDKFIETLPNLDKDASILDIGGGDGEVLNKILNKNKNLRGIIMDISENVGGMISRENKARVKTYAGTYIEGLRNILDDNKSKYLLISDVIHHIPLDKRSDFLLEVNSLCKEDTVLIIKEVEPGFIKSTLSIISDVCVSGDRNTKLISKLDLIQKITDLNPNISVLETRLFKIDPPNYCLCFYNFDS